MSLTCRNDLILTGPGEQRDRFVADVADAKKHCFFCAHAPSNLCKDSTPGADLERERWSGLRAHDRHRTEYEFDTRVPPVLWLVRACAAFPTLRFDLIASSHEDMYHGRVVAQNGELVLTENLPSRGWTDFDDDLPTASAVVADDVGSSAKPALEDSSKLEFLSLAREHAAAEFEVRVGRARQLTRKVPPAEFVRCIFEA